MCTIGSTQFRAASDSVKNVCSWGAPTMIKGIATNYGGARPNGCGP
eukprot:CAMPEP_0174305664 /NCGR_PEP_ID=MMETSP0809-20121228/61542_1 /TAXON_ID=73025 ORGANISM="Eutreptiella gymnastica-like, Strain CCMP1594" /NCGR_SAMPLE_ID=MMETSP0809 /ASSEMBLY_ACC=CAM_ASM_000658 /LENGTH=45 /DNA_ID= /DNA_START= /DNA_END= /DNA_ORIENTATION=